MFRGVRMFEIEEDKVIISVRTILDDSYLEEARNHWGTRWNILRVIWDGKGTTLSRNFVVQTYRDLVANEGVKV